MDLGKLNSNERLAFWGAVLSIIGTILTMISAYGFGAGGLWLTFLLAIAMIVILFLPTWSPQTSLPGSKGTLMLIVGGIAGIGAVLGLLALIPALSLLGLVPLFTIGLLVGIVGGLMMGWAGWQEFQSEGGKFQLGGATSGGTTTAPGERTVDTTSPPAERPVDTTTSTTTTTAPPPASTSGDTYARPAASDTATTGDAGTDRPYDRDDRTTS
jgi:hypothetical protein